MCDETPATTCPDVIDLLVDDLDASLDAKALEEGEETAG